MRCALLREDRKLFEVLIMMLVLLEDKANKSFPSRHIKTKISLKTMNAELICKQGFLRICKVDLFALS